MWRGPELPAVFVLIGLIALIATLFLILILVLILVLVLISVLIVHIFTSNIIAVIRLYSICRML